MNISLYYNLLLHYLSIYFPEQLDPSLKPRDFSECVSCRNILFDFIIVGAGSAGCVLANRLSANPKWKVLLIEAGDDEDYITDVPADFRRLIGTKYDWNFTTVPQENACLETEGICHYAAGHVMGGSSSINDVMFVRGNPQDYDDWETLGNNGWSYQELLPYFLKAENMTIPELAADTTYHSTGGPVTVGYGRYNMSLFQDLITTGRKLGLPVIDYNAVSQYGIAYAQSNIRESTRCSSSKVYLNPIRNRRNLYIFKNTKAIKVLFKGKSRKAFGVRCVNNGTEYNVYSKKEVILSAGTLNTPKLLMLSGIGPKEQLEKLDIQVLADLPVGKQLHDHTFLELLFDMKNLNCCNESIERIIIEYARNRRGPLTLIDGSVIAFTNVTTSASLPQFLIAFAGNNALLFDEEKKIFSIVLLNVHPKFSGNVKLNSRNYNDQLLIDPNTSGTEEDRDHARRAIRYTLKFMQSSTMKKYCAKWIVDDIPEFCNYTEPVTDEFLDCFMKWKGVLGLHETGTARMGPDNDSGSVVDPKLKVRLIKGLRVIDASVMPLSPRGNTNAITIMVAEKGSDIIIQDYNNRSNQ